MLSNVLRSSTRLAARVTPARSLSTLVASKAAFSVPRTASAWTASSVSRLAARAFSSAQTLAYEERRSRSERSFRPEQSEPSRAVYVGNMPWSMTKDEVMEAFSEFGTIESVRIQTHSDGRPRGFCHITFASEEQSTAAVSSAREEPIHVNGRDLVVDYAKLPANSYTTIEPNHKVYFQRFVGSETELRRVLGEFDQSVVSIFYIRDGNTGERQNNGFIEFPDVETAGRVIEALNGMELSNGESLVLSYARARKDGPRQERGERRAHYTGRDYRNSKY